MFWIVERVRALVTRPGPRIPGLAALHLRLAYGSSLYDFALFFPPHKKRKAPP